ncbi:MAG: MOSC domain-containing protein [Thermoplasmata archaeon]|nr:MOSC domain-containing protein [Thermoplasmata archaeon]
MGGSGLVVAGQVVSIHIAPEAESGMESHAEVRAVAGQGLEGDRYFDEKGTYSRGEGGKRPDRQLTLIEWEAIEALRRDYRKDLDPGDARRNVVTRGVALNHLVGREFQVGDVTLRGIRLCEPCGHLAGLVKMEVVPGLIHRGGLRAEILTTGTIRVGDPIVEAPEGPIKA